MTSRERWLGFIDGKPLDNLPFWAKFPAGYLEKQKSIGENIDETLLGSPWKIVDDCIIHQEELWECNYNEKERQELFKTPSGVLELLYHYDPISNSYYPEKHPIKSVDDIKIMSEWFSMATPMLHDERLTAARRIITQTEEKNEQITSTCSGASPFLYFVVHLAGLMDAHILFFEHHDEVMTLLNAALNYMKTRISLHLKYLRPDICLLVENMSTMVVSPPQFRDYVRPHVSILKQLCDKHSGRLGMQMPGHISGILNDLSEIDGLIIEGICSAPVGDTSLEMAQKSCPNMRIAGGTNAALWLESSESIIKQLKDDLDSMPHHRGVAITSSDMIPPETPLQTIVDVANFVKNYSIKN